MDKLIQKKEILANIRLSASDNFTCNEAAIIKEFKKQENNKSTLTIKILSIFGGVMGILTFIAFLIMAGLYESETAMVIAGFSFVSTAVLLNKIYNQLIIDTFSIATYIIGMLILMYALSEMGFQEDHVIILIGFMAILSLFVTQNYVLSFIAILLINYCMLYLITFYKLYYFVHLYIGVITLAFAYTSLNEVKLLSASIKISKLYAPFRIGLIFSLLISLIAIGKKDLFFVSQDNIWLSSLVIIPVNIYIISEILKIIDVKKLTYKIFIYTLTSIVFITLGLAPTILVAITIILLSFFVRYKTGFVIGIIAFIYFIAKYYYDLNFTLLTKSIILFCSGLILLLLYFFTNKYLLTNEKV